MSDDWEFSTEKFATEKYEEILQRHERNMNRDIPVMELDLWHWRQIFKEYFTSEKLDEIHAKYPNANRL